MKTVLLVIAVVFANIHFAWAQQSGRIYRIGYLDNTSLSATAPLLEAFRQQLREFGYIEGKDIAFEYQFGEGKGNEQLKALAAELVRRQVDVIVTRGDGPALAAKQTTSTIPIVMASIADPVGAGIVNNLAQPGGNITGISGLLTELITKRLELLNEVTPRLSRVGVLTEERGSIGTEQQIKELESAAKGFQVTLQYLEAKPEQRDLVNAFEAAVRERVDGIITTARPGFFAERKLIAQLAAKKRLPAIYNQSAFVEVGGLMSYGTNVLDLFRRAAIYVDKILKGAKPGDLPVEQPRKFELVLNLKAARQIGLTIPPNLLARADRIIK